MILVGSRAANFHITDFRQPKDWDFILPLRDIFSFSVNHGDSIDFLYPKNEWKFTGKLKTGPRFEIEVADYNPSAMLMWNNRHQFDEISLDGDSFLPTTVFVADPSWLCMMKRSHLYWNVHWDKSIADYHQLKELVGGNLTDDNWKFLDLRIKENEAKWGKSKTNLNVSNDEFFSRSQKIGRKYEHDELHEAVKYESIPLYQACKADQSKANLDLSLFKLWDKEQQQRLVREEAMVIALERVIIPKMLTGAPIDAQAAYHYALRRICTNLTSGWFRDFAIENWASINTPDVDYVKLFNRHFGR
jgi:hypothetical protein